MIEVKQLLIDNLIYHDDYLSIHIKKNNRYWMDQLDEIKEDNSIEQIHLPILDEIMTQMKSVLPTFDDKEKLDKWFIGLYKGSGFRLLDLVKESEDGTKDLSGIIEHNAFLDILIKAFTVRKRAGEYIVIDFLKSASSLEKAKISEEDKKYKPQYKEREKAEREKLTQAEKQIRKLTGLGMSREDAEKLILGTTCGKCGMRICKCEKKDV